MNNHIVYYWTASCGCTFEIFFDNKSNIPPHYCVKHNTISNPYNRLYNIHKSNISRVLFTFNVNGDTIHNWECK